jgi:alkylhydroperoxidase/carboxymuconolactone decarboxylase family protein YurZ
MTGKTSEPAAPTPATTAPDIAARLQAVKAKRGYLLPHHGLLAVTSERLLDAYDQAYTALALDMRELSVHDREFVWLAILIATDEALATHHIPKFRADGGSDDEIAAILRLSAWAMGGKAYDFVARHWLAHLPDFDPDVHYRSALHRLADGVSLRLALLAVAAVHAACGEHELLARAIILAYAADVPEPDLAEALSLVMFPGSVPNFVEASRVWLDLIRTGQVAPSPAFAAWAGLEGQGGHDEASRAAPT